MAFVSMNFTKNSGRGVGLRLNEISVNRKGCHSVTFSMELSEILREEGLYKVDFMRDDITGEIGLAFSRDRGISLTNKNKMGGEGKYHNLVCNCKQVVDWLFSYLPKDGDYKILTMGDNQSIKPGVRFYVIKGIRR